MRELLQKVEDYVRLEYSKDVWASYDYHNLRHTVNVVEQVNKLAKQTGLRKAESQTLRIAAWFHDLGYVLGVSGHEKVSADIAAKFLKENGSNDSIIVEVKSLIEATNVDYSNFDNISKKIIHDADLSNAGSKGFVRSSDALRSEWAKQQDVIYDDEEWKQFQIKFLSKLQYLSPAGIKKYDVNRKNNLSDYVNNLVNKSPVMTKKLGRGIETIYRVTYRNQINLSAIADNKANMMIGINALIISIVLTVFGSGLIGSFENLVSNLAFMIPLAILIISSSVAMVFSVLSARPNIVINKLEYNPDSLTAVNGILFFGNFTSLTREAFGNYMTSLQEDESITYKNMNDDIYNLGLVLKKKYDLLRKAYNIFMFGLILSIVLFFILFIVGNVT